jgi:hypothetical protein
MLAIILVLGSKAFGSTSYTRCARTQQRKDFDFNQQVKQAGEVLPSAAEIYPRSISTVIGSLELAESRQV